MFAAEVTVVVPSVAVAAPVVTARENDGGDENEGQAQFADHDERTPLMNRSIRILMIGNRWRESK